MNALYNVLVRVSRTWEFRGKSENNPLIHFDMVLIDQMVWLHTPLAPIFIEIIFQSISPTKLCSHNFKSMELELQGYAVYCEVPPQVLDQLKQYLEDYKFLSGTSACRWYINENDIPAMRTFQRGYFFSILNFKYKHLYLNPILMFGWL